MSGNSEDGSSAAMAEQLQLELEMYSHASTLNASDAGTEDGGGVARALQVSYGLPLAGQSGQEIPPRVQLYVSDRISRFYNTSHTSSEGGGGGGEGPGTSDSGSKSESSSLSFALAGAAAAASVAVADGGHPHPPSPPPPTLSTPAQAAPAIDTDDDAADAEEKEAATPPVVLDVGAASHRSALRLTPEDIVAFRELEKRLAAVNEAMQANRAAVEAASSLAAIDAIDRGPGFSPSPSSSSSSSFTPSPSPNGVKMAVVATVAAAAAKCAYPFEWWLGFVRSHPLSSLLAMCVVSLVSFVPVFLGPGVLSPDMKRQLSSDSFYLMLTVSVGVLLPVQIEMLQLSIPSALAWLWRKRTCGGGGGGGGGVVFDRRGGFTRALAATAETSTAVGLEDLVTLYQAILLVVTFVPSVSTLLSSLYDGSDHGVRGKVDGAVFIAYTNMQLVVYLACFVHLAMWSRVMEQRPEGETTKRWLPIFHVLLWLSMVGLCFIVTLANTHYDRYEEYFSYSWPFQAVFSFLLILFLVELYLGYRRGSYNVSKAEAEQNRSQFTPEFQTVLALTSILLFVVVCELVLHNYSAVTMSYISADVLIRSIAAVAFNIIPSYLHLASVNKTVTALQGVLRAADDIRNASSTKRDSGESNASTTDCDTSSAVPSLARAGDLSPSVEIFFLEGGGGGGGGAANNYVI